ncbi:MAG: ABC transporter permease [Clostridia bacterium]|nr:ABC transporter permease [Clostridia bacterium]
MKNLLKFEFHKLFRQKSFYVCAGIMAAFSILSIILIELVVKTTPDMSNLIDTPRSVWDIMLGTLNNANFVLIAGIFVAIFVCDDFSSGTIKNIYSRGFSKTKVFFAKLIVALTAVLIMYFANLIISIIMGLILFGTHLFHAKYIGLLFAQLALIIGYSTFAFSVSMIFKKIGPVIAITILVPMVIGLFLSLFDVALGLESLKAADFWLEGMAARLSTVATLPLQIILSAIGSLIYAAIFAVIGWYSNKKLENY